MKKSLQSLLVLCLLAINTFAQHGSNDPTFNPMDIGFDNGYGANSPIFTTALQPDGKIIIGGDFSSYNGTNRNRIARLNADGSLDTGFNPGTGANDYSTIYTTALQPDGKIIIGGNFTLYNSTARNGIARLNADGSLDMAFNPGYGVYSTIRTIALQPDGKIIIGGDFSSYNGTAINRIARLNADGSLDTAFNPGTGVNGSIYSAALQPDGKIIIVGYFFSYNGTNRNHIARLNADGSLDTGFNPGTGANTNIYTTALQPDGKIIIGGGFTSYNGTARNRIARVNADGSLDTGFNPGSGASSWVNTAALQPDGKIIIGGDFISYNGTVRNRIARLNANGSLDTGFNPGTGTSHQINATALQPDGKIIIGGNFISYNGMDRRRIVRLNADGSLDTGFNPGTGANNIIWTTALQPDGKIIIGGRFTSYNGTTIIRIARLNADGSLDAGFNPGTGANNTIRSAALQPDGKIIIGGNFSSYNGTARNYIARLNADGSLDTGFNPGTGANNDIYTSALQPDGKIIIGGDFTSYNGTIRNRIARLNADGSLDTVFNPGTGANGTIRTIALQPDGKIIIGGQFTSYNGTTGNRIARLNADGSLDTGFNPGTGANNTIGSAALQPDGKIIIGGLFTSYNGTVRYRIARLNVDGSLDTGFTGTVTNGSVSTITLQPDGKIIIGGAFTSYNGTARNYIARLNADGSLDTGFDPGTGTNNNIYTSAFQPDGKIIIGGEFTSYNGIGRNRIARINGLCVTVEGTDVITAYNSFTWIDGVEYTASNNTATFNIVGGAANGCDSLVTLNLTINYLAMGTDVITACNSHTWIDGVVYTVSNNTATFNIVGGAANGSDSLVTLNLTINNSTTGTDVITACNSHTWIDGVEYTTSNNTATFNIVGGAANGCDSLVTLNLTITNSTTNTTTEESCNSYTWSVNGQTYTASGTYTVVIGCHTEELVLTINSVSDISTTVVNETITANLSGASYQWLDCDNAYSPISGATSQSFTATSNGSYAVELTENGCVDTTACVAITNVGIIENSLGYKLVVHPNPTNGAIHITLPEVLLGQTMVLTNVFGQVLQTTILNSTSVEYDLSNFAAGIYFIQVQTNDGVIIRQIVKN